MTALVIQSAALGVPFGVVGGYWVWGIRRILSNIAAEEAVFVPECFEVVDDVSFVDAAMRGAR